MKTFKKFLEDIDYYKIPGLSQEPIKSKVVIPPTEVKKKKVDYYKFGIERVREAYSKSERESHKRPTRFLDLLNKTFDDAGPKSPMPIIKKSPPGTVPPVTIPNADNEPVIFKKSPMAKKSTSVKRA